MTATIWYLIIATTVNSLSIAALGYGAYRLHRPKKGIPDDRPGH